MKKPSHLFSALVALAATAGFSASASAQEPSPTEAASPAAQTSSTTPSSGAQSSKTEGTKKTKATLTTAESTAGAQTAKGTSTAQLSSADRKFMMNAAKGGMMEVHMGEMAEKQGQSADVKKLGARIVADHTKANNELMALAQARGVKLDTRHKMDKMDGANFDQQWLASMVKDHEKDIAEFQKEAQSGTDPELKSFASKTLPTLQKHLKMVRTAQQKVGGTTMPPDAKSGSKTKPATKDASGKESTKTGSKASDSTTESSTSESTTSDSPSSSSGSPTPAPSPSSDR